MSRVLDFLYDPELLITLLVAVAAFATTVTIAMPMFQGDRLASRLKYVATQREELRRKHREQLEKKDTNRSVRNEVDGFMKNVVEKLNLRRIIDSPELKQLLSQAGFRGQRPAVVFVIGRITLPLVAFISAVIYLFFMNDMGWTPSIRIAASLGAAIIGSYFPNIIVKNIRQKRQSSIMMAFPDALDLMLICVEAGMSIEVAFKKVATEIGGQSIELAEELSLTTAELSYLQDRRVGYENLALRTGHQGVKAVCTSLIQSERYGTPVGQALRVMADENRQMRMQLAEKKAAALPAKLTVPMIVFFLPVLFIVILGPAYIRFKITQ